MARPPKRDIPFFIDKILPRYGVHLLGGPSGAGKTTWLFQMLKAWSTGEHILGLEEFAVTPAAYAYVSCDRPAEDTWYNIDRVGFRPKDEALILAWDEEVRQPKNLSGLQNLMDRLPIKNGLLCIDDLAALMQDGDSNNGRDVRAFMRSVRLLGQSRSITIIGCVHNAKAKPGDEYKAPRQRIAGSAEWGHYAGTVFLIEQDNDVGADRTFWYQPRHYRDGKVPMLMNDNGELLLAEQDITNMALEQRLAALKAGEHVSTKEILDWAKEARIPQRTAERWIRDMLEMGKIERVSKGLFRKTLQQ